MRDVGWLLFEVVMLLAGIQELLWCYNYGFDAATQKIKLENRQPLVGLKKLGFVADSDSHRGQPMLVEDAEAAKYRGCVNGYPVEVSTKCQPVRFWGNSPSFKVKVFFDAEKAAMANPTEQAFRNKGPGNFFKWNDGVTLTPAYAERELVVGRYSRPDSRQLFAAAQELATEVRKLGLIPAAVGAI